VRGISAFWGSLSLVFSFSFWRHGTYRREIRVHRLGFRERDLRVPKNGVHVDADPTKPGYRASRRG